MAMQCKRAIIYYMDGKPASYSLILDGCEDQRISKDARSKETSFREVYETFAAIRKHWKVDGTAKD